MTIGEYIRECRLKKEYSQRKLAINAGISNTTISRIESNIVTPDTETLSKIASALNEPIINFITLQENTTGSITSDNKKDISKDISSIISKIKADEDGQIYYNGVPMDEDDAELFEQALEFAMKSIEIQNKQKSRK